VAGRPTDGRPVGEPPRIVRSGRPGPPPVPRRTPVRSAGRPAPLVARTDLHALSRQRTTVRSRPGRVRRFVRRYGWRAYAVPLLALATIAVLLDIAFLAPTGPTGTAGSTATQTEQGAAPTAPVTAETQPTPAAEGDAEPAQPPPPAGPETYVEKGAGTLAVVDGSSQVLGSGPLQRFIVEVEDGIDVDGAGFAAAVEATLGDPRSWGNGGRMSFQRVGAAEAAAGQFEFRVSLVSPGNMESYCPGVGTGGYTSCRYGDRAVINLARWATAVPDYQGDVATYRQYVVNHEVGHVLGNGHQPCPGAGQVAPVMQQQTLGLEGCVKNAWPYP
jgi:hypothetical protein